MSVECPKCHRLVTQVCRCSKCKKVKCADTTSRGGVRLGCSAKETSCWKTNITWYYKSCS